MILGTALLLLGAYELNVVARESVERHAYWELVREYCDSVRKPLLRIGMRRSFTEPPNGDVTLDLDPAVQGISGGVWGDERDMPFSTKEFGVCFNEHTLEHLRTAEDVQLAVNECVRVADRAVFLAPSPYGIYSSMFCPTHNLRLWFDRDSNSILVKENTDRTGMGYSCGISQALVTDDPPLVISSQESFVVVPLEGGIDLVSLSEGRFRVGS